MGFVTEQIGDIGCVAFGAHLSFGLNPWWGNLVPLDGAGDGLFGPLRCLSEEEEKPVMVHSGFLHMFLSVYNDKSFQKQVSFYWRAHVIELLVCFVGYCFLYRVFHIGL